MKRSLIAALAVTGAALSLACGGEITEPEVVVLPDPVPATVEPEKVEEKAEVEEKTEEKTEEQVEEKAEVEEKTEEKAPVKTTSTPRTVKTTAVGGDGPGTAKVGGATRGGGSSGTTSGSTRSTGGTTSGTTSGSKSVGGSSRR